ncbi:hypothetical protein DPX16_18869 [Anabarilius grahami]|uniref:Uncharacterized protein n=1 Tax=Anabarilius grahami TaxID=495550 RepID=A0A3N0YMF1_ANAGA|nr:hypothetical protein DPX16_18869 [Anabarilius grahami]
MLTDVKMKTGTEKDRERTLSQGSRKLQITHRVLGNSSNQRHPISTDAELNQTLILTATLFDRDWIGLCGKCCQKIRAFNVTAPHVAKSGHQGNPINFSHSNTAHIVPFAIPPTTLAQPGAFHRQ